VPLIRPTIEHLHGHEEFVLGWSSLSDGKTI
jgi:hypothetical protein